MSTRAKTTQDFLTEISCHAFMDETEAVRALLAHTDIFQKKSKTIFSRAKAYVKNIREHDHTSGVESFMHQYGLETREGVMIMCLAEALLRVPDADTADALIHDKLHETEWEPYIGRSESVFVNASTWGMLLTGKVVTLGDATSSRIGSLLGKLISRIGEPAVREALKKAMHLIGNQFVMGETIEEAFKHGKEPKKKGYLFSYDVLGEGARSMPQAERYYKDYMEAITAIGKKEKDQDGDLLARPGISVKLSALHPRYELLQRERLEKELLPKLKNLVEHAMDNNIAVSIDAEEATRLDISLILFQALVEDPLFENYNGIGFVLQAYQKRALYVIDFLAHLAKTYNKRIPIRLVKGAYWDAEIKHAQMAGLPDYPVFTHKSYTDVSYLACARKILENSLCFYPQFASHNALTVASILEIAKGKEFEFQRLYGMGETFYDQLVESHRCRVYAPVGRYKDLLPYLIRRLLENTANSSFVNLLVDDEQPIAKLLKSPVNIAEERGGSTNPDIPLPENIYGDRKNSQGFDPGNYCHMEILKESFSRFEGKEWDALPFINGEWREGKRHKLHSPSNNKAATGHVAWAERAACEAALEAAQAGFSSWSRTPANERAAVLEKTGDLIEEHRDELMALCMKEAGKTLSDAIGEVREAADFCRYYALQARKLFGAAIPLKGPTGESNHLILSGRGVFICISPWNFPLAIFTGQVTAALAAGNSVVAKPAEQTPMIAALAVKLMHEAGIPAGALHLLPGDGKTGARLVDDERIAGVVFTGSTETAKSINLSLAKREGPIIPLIAETGGQNAMIVDSTALLEQAVDDVLLSAFGSAGQRCSALRVLYIQDDIAKDFITLLSDALQELTLADPALLTTDIGPVIDHEAQKHLLAHIERMKKRANLVASLKCDLPDGHYVPPHIFEIRHINELKGEVFGPILHVIRFKARDLDKVIEQINSTGYGLTFGMHSRIEERYNAMPGKIHAGNMYINRSMTGATVGVQPFGGEGLSGTGPKAGGPHYLLRFATERCFTVNTAAIGGNLELLA